KSTGGSRTLAHYTDSFQELCPAVLALFDKYKRPHELIRRIAVSFEDLVNKAAVPTEMDLFSNALTDTAEQEEHIQKTMLNIKGRFGKNAILRASSLQEEGTMQFRNTLVGGHNGE
ncbi:MAG: DNA repair protein, partial [Veillonella sp.]|nr:DNA repair protein [Veillonella sp.]